GPDRITHDRIAGPDLDLEVTVATGAAIDGFFTGLQLVVHPGPVLGPEDEADILLRLIDDSDVEFLTARRRGAGVGNHWIELRMGTPAGPNQEDEGRGQESSALHRRRCQRLSSGALRPRIRSSVRPSRYPRIVPNKPSAGAICWL